MRAAGLQALEHRFLGGARGQAVAGQVRLDPQVVGRGLEPEAAPATYMRDISRPTT